MRLRTFTAADMPSAMKLVRAELGDNAIILASEVHKSKKTISVTAAVEEDDDDGLQITDNKNSIPPSAIRHPSAEPLRFQIQECLRFHNIPELFIAKLMQRASDKDLAAITSKHNPLPLALEQLLDGFFEFDPLSFDPGTRIMLVGPPGTGKTLTIARIAAMLARDKQPLAIITTDNKRAGGVEQLQAFTDILDIPLGVAASKAELAHYLKSQNARTRVLIDTAGCNAFDGEDLNGLKSYMANGIEPVLALPAGGDSLEAIDIVEAYSAVLPIKRLLVTRADTARRFGGIVAAAAAHGLSFCDAAASSSITKPLQPFDAALLARYLLKYQYDQLQTS